MDEREDYAVRAAREHYAGYCVSNAVEQAERNELVNRLASIIRKHSEQGVDIDGVVYFPKCKHTGDHYPFCGHPDF